jgi:alanine racemase
VRADGVDPGVLHTANSAATILEPDSRLDMVRPGLAIYGLYPSDACRQVVELRPAMRVVSHVSLTRRLAAGARPSYGRRRMLPQDATVATVPVGYADGFSRRLSEVGEVLVGGRRRPLAGTVTMDQIVVDVGNDPVTVGDEVVLLGAQGTEEITADEWADKTGTISYEVVCGIGPRLPRRYPDQEDAR